MDKTRAAAIVGAALCLCGTSFARGGHGGGHSSGHYSSHSSHSSSSHSSYEHASSHEHSSSTSSHSESSRTGSSGTHYVAPHVTKSGQLVRGHEQTNANESKLDNWSTKGNVNPRTGEPGTKSVSGVIARVRAAPLYVAPTFAVNVRPTAVLRSGTPSTTSSRTSNNAAAPVATAQQQSATEPARLAQEKGGAVQTFAPGKVGQESFQVEKMARSDQCAQPVASLASKGAGFETYRVVCGGGAPLIYRCETGSCNLAP